MDCSPPGSSAHGIFQARILEWDAISFSRGSSWPRNQKRISYISCVGRQPLYRWAIGKPRDFLWAQFPSWFLLGLPLSASLKCTAEISCTRSQPCFCFPFLWGLLTSIIRIPNLPEPSPPTISLSDTPSPPFLKSWLNKKQCSIFHSLISLPGCSLSQNVHLFKVCQDPAPVKVVEQNKKLLSLIQASSLYIDLTLIPVPKRAGKRQPEVGGCNFPSIDSDSQSDGRSWVYVTTDMLIHY